jgi:hypothetical protein
MLDCMRSSPPRAVPGCARSRRRCSALLSASQRELQAVAQASPRARLWHGAGRAGAIDVDQGAIVVRA